VIILQIVVAFGAAVTLFYCIACINRMSATTNHGIRAAYILIAAGAFGEIAAIFSGHVPGVAETLFMTGCGLLDFIDRRCVVRRELQGELSVEP
jgi:hypothetical protein